MFSLSSLLILRLFECFFGDLVGDFLVGDSNLVSSLICSIFAYTLEIIYDDIPQYDPVMENGVDTGRKQLVKGNPLVQERLNDELGSFRVLPIKEQNKMKVDLKDINTTIDFLNQIYSKFRIDIDQNNMEGEIYGIKQLTNYQFNEEYYYSDDFFGLLTRAEIYVNNYSRLINDISKNLEQAKIYAEYEIND